MFFGRLPLKVSLTDFGTLNQLFPLAQAAAISLSPIPCPKAPIDPRILACESVEIKVQPGVANPLSITRCVPIPEFTS